MSQRHDDNEISEARKTLFMVVGCSSVVTIGLFIGFGLSYAMGWV